jgi:transposase-like protein
MANAKSAVLAALRHAAVNEAQAVVFLEQQRWGDAPACPRCGDADVYKMTSRDGQRNKDYRWRCKGCKQMFTVRTNTIFEESRLPLRVWVFAFWKACSSKKGMSALQLAREMEITHKSALFVLRRIRHGLGYDRNNDPKHLHGTVEVDETYVGGKPRYKFGNKRGTSSKTPVIAMVQREGDVRFQMMPRVTAAKLADAIIDNVSVASRIVTDESQAYWGIGRQFLGGHQTVTHVRREYVRLGTDVHSNTVESVFSLLKRGIMGTFHSVSVKHLPNYLNEFEFRYNTRKVDDGTRVSKAIKRVHGKRLTYRESVDNPPYFAPPKQPSAPFEG